MAFLKCSGKSCSTSPSLFNLFVVVLIFLFFLLATLAPVFAFALFLELEALAFIAFVKVLALALLLVFASAPRLALMPRPPSVASVLDNGDALVVAFARGGPALAPKPPLAFSPVLDIDNGGVVVSAFGGPGPETLRGRPIGS